MKTRNIISNLNNDSGKVLMDYNPTKIKNIKSKAEKKLQAIQI